MRIVGSDVCWLVLARRSQDPAKRNRVGPLGYLTRRGTCRVSSNLRIRLLLAGTPPGNLVSMVATCRLHTFAFRRNLRCVLAAAMLTIGALAGTDAAEPSEETAFGWSPR